MLLRRLFARVCGLLALPAAWIGMSANLAAQGCATGDCATGCATGPCLRIHCPVLRHCQEGPVHIKVHVGCSRPFSNPCAHPTWGYYETCWVPRDWPLDFGHCPVLPPAAVVPINPNLALNSPLGLDPQSMYAAPMPGNPTAAPVPPTFPSPQTPAPMTPRTGPSAPSTTPLPPVTVPRTSSPMGEQLPSPRNLPGGS